MTTTKKKQMFTPDNSAGTFTPNVSSAIDSVKKTASDIGAGIKETAQKLGEAVPGVTSIGQSLKSYANMNNYKADESTAQEKLDYLDSTSPGKYTESQGLTELRGQLTQVENQKPEEFDNKYQQQIDALLGKMTSQEPFSYDFSTDSNWLAAQEQAKRNALLAMENAMGEAAGLTGGYTSSAAQMVGQQVYQQEISETTEMIPEFAQMALNKWQANNSQMASNLAALQSQQDSDYSRYYNDWQLWNQDRAYMYQKVQDMSDDEFNKYLTELQRWQVDRAYYADQKQIAIQNQQWQLELNESRRQFNQQMAFNYINMGVGATVDLTTAGMSAGVQLAGIGVDAALGAADLYEDHRQFDAQMAYNEKWAQNDYDLAMAQLAEEKRQFDIKNGSGTQAVKSSGSSGGSGTTKSTGGSGNTSRTTAPVSSGETGTVDYSKLQGPLIPGGTLDDDLKNTKSNSGRAQALAIAYQEGSIDDDELEAYKKKYGLR